MEDSDPAYNKSHVVYLTVISTWSTAMMTIITSIRRLMIVEQRANIIFMKWSLAKVFHITLVPYIPKTPECRKKERLIHPLSYITNLLSSRLEVPQRAHAFEIETGRKVNTS